MPTLFIIAGPNGAGKTTAAYTVFPHVLNVMEFVNADEIARGLSPFQPESVALQAGRIMLERVDELITSEKDFVVETTLSGRAYVGMIEKAKAKGYSVKLIFVYVSSADVSVNRVAQRVSKGGHNIPEQTIRRRYILGLKNFVHLFKDRVDSWALYDNEHNHPVLVANYVNGQLEIYDYRIWAKITSY